MNLTERLAVNMDRCLIKSRTKATMRRAKSHMWQRGINTSRGEPELFRRAGQTMSLLLFTFFSSALAVPAPCPVLPPMDCGEGMVNCPGPADPMGCSMPDLCIAIGVDCPMGGGNSSTQCPSLPPMDCGEGFTNCPGPLDPMGCAMPDTCKVEGDQCGEGMFSQLSK